MALELQLEAVQSQFFADVNGFLVDNGLKTVRAEISSSSHIEILLCEFSNNPELPVFTEEDVKNVIPTEVKKRKFRDDALMLEGTSSKISFRKVIINEPYNEFTSEASIQWALFKVQLIQTLLDNNLTVPLNKLNTGFSSETQLDSNNTLGFKLLGGIKADKRSAEVWKIVLPALLNDVKWVYDENENYWILDTSNIKILLSY